MNAGGVAVTEIAGLVKATFNALLHKPVRRARSLKAGFDGTASAALPRPPGL